MFMRLLDALSIHIHPPQETFKEVGRRRWGYRKHRGNLIPACGNKANRCDNSLYLFLLLDHSRGVVSCTGRPETESYSMYPAEYTKCNQLKHSSYCQMSFGRKDMQCPRCVEMAAGAPARSGWQRDHFATKARNEAMDREAIRGHFAPGGPHATGKCGPVCTAFDW